MGGSGKVKVQTAGQIWADVEYGNYQDSSDNHLFVPIEDVERMIKEAWFDAHFLGFMSVDGEAKKDFKESQTAASLRAMKEE